MKYEHKQTNTYAIKEEIGVFALVREITNVHVLTPTWRVHHEDMFTSGLNFRKLNQKIIEIF